MILCLPAIPQKRSHPMDPRTTNLQGRGHCAAVRRPGTVSAGWAGPHPLANGSIPVPPRAGAAKLRTSNKTKSPTCSCRSGMGMRQRPTLPGRLQPSTIGVLRLNFCVRNGNRWNPQAITTASGEQDRAGRSVSVSPFRALFSAESSFSPFSEHFLSDSLSLVLLGASLLLGFLSSASLPLPAPFEALRFSASPLSRLCGFAFPSSVPLSVPFQRPCTLTTVYEFLLRDQSSPFPIAATSRFQRAVATALHRTSSFIAPSRTLSCAPFIGLIKSTKSSYRPISIIKLHTLLHFHR